MRNLKIAMIVLVLMFNVLDSFACGQCVQDKMAAVYDYEVIKTAVSQKHVVIFMGFQGSIVPDLESRLKILKLIMKINGIDGKSIKISMENASFSVAFDPERISYNTLLKVFSKNFLRLSLSVFPIDTIKSL